MKRRALLSSLSGSLLVGVAGCLGSQTPASPETATDSTTEIPTTASPTREQTQTATPVPKADLGVKNESDREYTLTVQVTQTDETLLDRSVEVSGGPGYWQNVEHDFVGAGAYTVVAELDTGARLEYKWRVQEGDSSLDIVITSEGALEPREHTTIEVDDESLPYAVPGAKDIWSAPNIFVRNESDEDTEVTLSLEYRGDRFFDQSFDAKPNHELLIGPVVKSHGTYGVVVETADGRRDSYEWAIPAEWGWPMLAVLVAEDGTLRVGGSWPRTVGLPVENSDDTEHEVTTTLTDGEMVVSENTQTVEPGTDHLVADVPIGGNYEVTVETETGTASVPYVANYCWNTRAEVSIEGGTPTIESYEYYCS